MILESSIAEDSIVVAFGTYTGTYKATGKSMTAAFAHRWEVVAGKIRGFRQYTDTAFDDCDIELTPLTVNLVRSCPPKSRSVLCRGRFQMSAESSPKGAYVPESGP